MVRVTLYIYIMTELDLLWLLQWVMKVLGRLL